MYLQDYLHDIPLKALKSIAQTLNVSVEYGARIKLINSIDRAFWDGTLTRRLFSNISDDNRLVLSLIAFSFNAGVSENSLHRKIERLAGLHKSDVKKLMHDLIPIAFVGGVRMDNHHYFCPCGVAEQLRKLLLQKTVKFPEDDSRTTPMTQPNLLEDIFAFLAHAYKDSIPLTLKKRVKKTVLNQIFNNSPTCVDSSLHFSEEHRNRFVMEYLKKRRLLSLEGNTAKTTRRLGGWIDLSATGRLQDIVSFALQYVLQDTASIIAFSGIMSELPVGASFNVKGLSMFLHTQTMAPQRLTYLELHVQEILCIFNQLGLFSFTDGRFIKTEAGELFFRGETLPIDENTSKWFTIQPNFEVIAGPEIETRVRFFLELLSEHKNRDTVLTYTLTQKGIARAREHGMSTIEIINFFNNHSRNQIPQNVHFSIKSWADLYGSIFFEKAVLMRFRDPAMCSSVFHDPKIAHFIKEQLSDTVLVVSSENINIIAVALKKAGYLPEKFYETPPDSLLYGLSYRPDRYDDMLAKFAIPLIHHTFMIPETLYENDKGA